MKCYFDLRENTVFRLENGKVTYGVYGSEREFDESRLEEYVPITTKSYLEVVELLEEYFDSQLANEKALVRANIVLKDFGI